MTSLSDNFRRFSNELNQAAVLEGEGAAANWEETLQNGRLTQYINDTFLKIGATHDDIFNRDRGRNTTIQPTLYEIFLGKLIKSLLEVKMKDEGIEVWLDTYIPLNARKTYPDVLIRKEGKPIGCVSETVHLNG